MILLDFSNIIVGSIMVASRIPDDERFSEDFIRHLVLNSIRSYRKKYNQKYGEMVICTDHLSSWRKSYYPFYKAHRQAQRKKQEDKQGVDWSALFTIINKITDELEDTFPYKVMRIPHAEGDDVIAVLTKYANDRLNEPSLIVSSDKDFNQLYKYKIVRQYSPMKHQIVKGIDPISFLKEHIIRGDKSDGIPNILSADDCFAKGTRQKPLAKKKVEMWLNQKPEDFCTNGVMKHYIRNRELIDFDYIPQPIVDKITRAFHTPLRGDRRNLLNYFIKHRLKLLIDHIGDF